MVLFSLLGRSCQWLRRSGSQRSKCWATWSPATRWINGCGTPLLRGNPYPLPSKAPAREENTVACLQKNRWLGVNRGMHTLHVTMLPISCSCINPMLRVGFLPALYGKKTLSSSANSLVLCNLSPPKKTSTKVDTVSKSPSPTLVLPLLVFFKVFGTCTNTSY